MFSKSFAALLATALLMAAFSFPTTGRAQTSASTVASDKARATVQKVGVGRDAKVDVKLRDNSTIKGYISASEKDSFTLTDAKTGTSRNVLYAEVNHVKKHSSGLSTRTWVIIGAATVAAIIIGVTVVKPVVCDGGAQSRGLC